MGTRVAAGTGDQDRDGKAAPTFWTATDGAGNIEDKIHEIENLTDLLRESTNHESGSNVLKIVVLR